MLLYSQTAPFKRSPLITPLLSYSQSAWNQVFRFSLKGFKVNVQQRIYGLAISDGEF